jgi:hypothetical protein
MLIDNSCSANPVEIVNHLPHNAGHHLVIIPPMVQVRAPTQPPSASQHRQLNILFRHPGYDDCNNVLFKLHVSALDNDGQPGLFAQFAIDVCVVIAGITSAGAGFCYCGTAATRSTLPARRANVAIIIISMPSMIRMLLSQTSVSGLTRTTAFLHTGNR